MWELGRDVHPFQYGHNNPLRRIDRDGNWDVDVHFYHDRQQVPHGVMNVRNRHGEIVFTMTIRGTGVGGHDRMETNNDTPTGEYDIKGWKTPTDKERMSYGPNPRLVLDGLSGEIIESGRTDIRVHGGRQEKKDANGNWVPIKDAELKSTHGCMRSKDDDIKKMKEITDGLQNSDPKEKPGILTVKNDLSSSILTPQPVNPTKDQK